MPSSLRLSAVLRAGRRLNGNTANRFVTLLIEYCIVFGTGIVVGTASRLGTGLLQSLELAAVYCALICLMEGVGVAPRHMRVSVGLRAVAAAFVCGFAFNAAFAMYSAEGALTFAVWFAGAAAGIALFRTNVTSIACHVPAIWPSPPRALVIGFSPWTNDFVRRNRVAGAAAEYEVVGVFDEGNGPHPFEGVESAILREGATSVFLSIPQSDPERIERAAATLRFLPVTVRLAPDRSALSGPVESDPCPTGDMAVIARPPFPAFGLFAKRGLDILGSVVLLVLLIPLFTSIAMLIKIDSNGPVFFRQKRSGQFGRDFTMFKFRSLHVLQADAAAETLVTQGDSRVTRVGRYLRKYSLDELPQLINVVLGSMSLVGPRPHASRAKADGRLYGEVRPDYRLRYRAKPGMTGWAQVNGWRGNTDTAEKLHKRVEYDFDYIGRWSLMMDLRILLLTIPSVIAPPSDNA